MCNIMCYVCYAVCMHVCGVLCWQYVKAISISSPEKSITGNKQYHFFIASTPFVCVHGDDYTQCRVCTVHKIKVVHVPLYDSAERKSCRDNPFYRDKNHAEGMNEREREREGEAEKI